MENRYDSVDALMYAYYEFMRTKEANKMLEKNKDYIEFSMWSFMATHKPGQCTDINITGINPEWEVLGVNNPFDIPCDVVVVTKRAFDRLQADNQHYREMVKQLEENYNLLLEKTGFTSVTDLIDYIHDPSMTSPEDKTLREIIDDCEEDYILERDKVEALQKENKELKKKLQVPDPFAEYKELLEKLHSKEDVEKFEWTLNHICGGHASANGWMVTAKLWRRNYESLSKLVGFSSTEEIQDYLTNEAECNTLQEAVSKLKDQVKYTCDEWYSANSRNNSWKAAAECNSPKELIEKREALEKEIQVYSRALKEWKEGTGCPSPSSAKTMIESQASWCHAYHEVKEKNEKLADVIKSWQKATGYSTPEGLLSAVANDPDNVWRDATGFGSPLEANMGIRDYKDTIQKWKDMTKCETPEAAATWITSYEKACERGNELAEGAEEREKEWQDATGRISPEAAKQYIDRLKGRLNKIHGYSVDW